MEKSVLSRFQGGLLGSLIAESIKKNNHPQTGKKHHWQQISKGAQIGFHLLKQISQNHKPEGVNCYPDEILHWQNTLSSSEMALAILPVTLLFYENKIVLKEILQKTAAIWLKQTESLEDILIWEKAIAYALKGKPATIAQILEEEKKWSTPMVEELKMSQKLLGSQTGLEQVKTILSRSSNQGSRAMALALYCFSYTPEDFSKAVKRALNTNTSDLQITAALTGAIAGVYNSYSGIPVSWRLALQQNKVAEETSHNVKRLFALWCGVYDPETTELDKTVTCYGTGLIQRRSQLKIISQKDNKL